jgi:cleavage and polyadenylation specificity factor subunit 1
MQAYTELAPPSAVTHSLSLPLTSASANNLVVAKGSLLQIFAVKTVAAELDAPKDENATPTAAEPRYDHRINDENGLESSFLGGESLILRTDNSTNTKLVLVAEIPLAGTVIGLARLKLTSTTSGGEALLLAYRSARLCLTEWDPQRNTLETLSLHYYEKDDLQSAPWELSLGEYVNYLAADPGSRCAAFKFGSRNLAILPLRVSEQDIEMDGWDEDLDGPRPVKKTETATNGNVDGDSKSEAPYNSSFVLRLPLLDSSLLHPIHMAFLHEYREPTFGILTSTQPKSTSLGVKDHLTYKVFTLDLQQKASTTILSVTDLPRDLFQVMALPAPIGGALLVGENEIIHVDQSGKTNGVAVNPMTKNITSFTLSDESSLNLRLEGCTIEILSIELGDLLLITKDGRLAVITFRIDGRTVSGIDIGLVSKENGGEVIKTGASCISKLNKSALFVGSENSDSVVLGWTRKQTQEKKRKARAFDPDLDIDVDDLDLDDDEDDDLYGNDSAVAKPVQAATGSRAGEMSFRIHDRLLSIAPIVDITCGQPSASLNDEDLKLSKGVISDLSLACAVGKGRAGSLAILNRQIQPKVVGSFDFPEARGFWTMCVKKPVPKPLATSAPGGGAGDFDTVSQYDKYMIVAKVDLDGYETSDVYALTAAGFESIKDTEFEPAAGFTIEAGTMGKKMRIIQVLRSEVRCYDGGTCFACYGPEEPN